LHDRDDSISSFDGTRIVLSFFPADGLKAVQKAPTVLFGPGWSHGSRVRVTKRVAKPAR
jgi:hypothetical protein